MKRTWALLMLSFFCKATDNNPWTGLYFYPCFWVGEMQHPIVYCIHQTKEYHLELWGLDYENKVPFKALPAQFMPMQVALLPENRGISFLDKGRIRVKLFTKRSIMNIDIDAPLYDIFSYFWVDQNALCVCAKQYKNYTISHLSITGDLETIVEDPAHHLICPQKIDESLFYIKHHKDGTSYFMETEYPATKMMKDDAQDFDECIKQFLVKKDKKEEKKHEQIQLLELENIHSPIFLSMIKKDRGFLVDYSDYEKSQLNCYYLEQNNGEWVCSKIFEYIIPHRFITTKSPERLVESLFPLMPKYNNGKIYFVDYYNNKLAIFSYDVNKDEIILEFADDKMHVFCPIFMGDSLFSGNNIF